ncbi:hypothetical protein K435DRAFT_961909 [Dendrothele bispora CBS 962.96]|uniref:DASH complex subunit ASK1 n=1 Tax=Dendrothele bispora (strain CBS 962.96) TaxID=1314807 RepID=A0A4S8MND5_DENBC|nr:hypothetical protein K435DRAFT_961909 [Dendrothele bispora CBS 962.96]
MIDQRKPITPPPRRWRPNPDPASIEVPGVDTNASPHDQIEQIEQLITLKLQNIDENFSKIHHILTTRILPSMKRYRAGTEPVREAAKFWVEFYEQAAQIRIPTSDDYETVNEQSSEHTEQSEESHSETFSVQEQESGHDDETILGPPDDSCLPGQATYASTPAGAAGGRVASADGSFATRQFDETGSSWSASIESPLLRLDRQLRDFSEEEETETETSSSTPSKPSKTVTSFSDADEPSQISSARASEKGKRKEQPLLRSILRHNLYTSRDPAALTPGVSTSPLRLKGKIKTPVPRDLNPYLPPNSQPRDWNGIVDLRDRTVSTPAGQRSYAPASLRKPGTPATARKPYFDDDDDSFDGLPPGMSPPKFLSPARLPRSSAELGLLKLGQSPSKDAVARITRDLVKDAQTNSTKSTGKNQMFSDSSLSTVDLPDMSRYDYRNPNNNSVATSTDTSLENLMRQVGLREPPIAPPQPLTPDTRAYEWSSAGESDLGSGSHQDVPPRQEQSQPQVTPEDLYDEDDDSFTYDQQPLVQQLGGNHPDLDDDDDSYFDDFDEEGDGTAQQPSAAFLMASQNRRIPGDDSFDSESSMESIDQEGMEGMPVHPFARMAMGGGGMDDSFDDSFDVGEGEVEEETLFGVPPGQREAIASRNLMLRGGDLFLDSEGLTEDINQVEESPTPWNRG